jgi:hypothetical protein
LPRRINTALHGIAKPQASIQAAFKGTTATICWADLVPESKFADSDFK